MTEELNQHINGLKPSLLGMFLYYCVPYRKRVIKSNIEQVFQTSLSKIQKKRLIQSFYSHLARSLKENILMRFMSEKAIVKKVVIKGEDNFLAVADKNKGIIVLTGHFGNWEFAPIAGILGFKEYQGSFHFIRKSLKNKWLEKILFRRYFKVGLNVIPKENSLNQVCDALDNNHAVVFVMDQHANLGSKDGIAVEFFGRKAGTYRSLATLTRYTGVPVLPSMSYRQDDGTHVLEFFPAIEWQDHEKIRQAIYINTLQYNQALEKMVLKRPEQWMWMHKRWKL